MQVSPSDVERDSGPELMVRGSSVRLFLIVVMACFAYAILRYHVFKGVEWSHLPLYITNKAVSLSSVILLALCYLLAPRSSEANGRGVLVKFLGLAGFSLAALHAAMSLALLSPNYYEKFFGEGKMNLTGELSMMLGVLAALFLAIVALSSIPGVRDSMSIPRWRRVQRAGYLGLVLIASHCLVMGIAGWLKPVEWPGGMPPISLAAFAATLVPLVARVFTRRSA